MKKKISLIGIFLGFIAGAFVAMLSGSWIFWLSVGLAIGVVLGSAGARATQRSARSGTENMRANFGNWGQSA